MIVALTNHFQHRYLLTLALALPGPDFSEEDRRGLETGIADYNSKTLQMNNPKTIEIQEIGKNYIKLVLSSTQVLTTPGRGLRALTTSLIKDPSSCFKDRVTPGGQLFRVVAAEQLDACDNDLMNPASISDGDLVKALVDYFSERKDGSAISRKKKIAVEEMKKLAVEASMIRLSPRQDRQ